MLLGPCTKEIPDNRQAYSNLRRSLSFELYTVNCKQKQKLKYTSNIVPVYSRVRERMSMCGANSYSVSAPLCYLRCTPSLYGHQKQNENAERDGESARRNWTFGGTGGRHTGGRKFVCRNARLFFIIFVTRIKYRNS